ncbi:MAG: 5-deoxy-glucuronate isomerase, partial [Clostridia bacterium]|nr:5-deoxy-glucuronate isomerase [Clostridia bacterium]
MYFEKQVSRGYTPYLTRGENDHVTNINVGLLILEQGDEYTVDEPALEVALDLLVGKVEFVYEGKTETADRPDTFHYAAWCLHVCKGTKVVVRALNHAELYVQSTDNDRTFESRLYTPNDIMVQHAGANGELMGCMRREIQTFIDYESAPYSNMVLGEVMNFPGKWSSYP